MPKDPAVREGLAGGGLGALVGLLVGMTTAEVVGGVITGLEGVSAASGAAQVCSATVDAPRGQRLTLRLRPRQSRRLPSEKGTPVERSVRRSGGLGKIVPQSKKVAAVPGP